MEKLSKRETLISILMHELRVTRERAEYVAKYIIEEMDIDTSDDY